MKSTFPNRLFWGVAVALQWVCALASGQSITYQVDVDTSVVTGLAGRVVFDFTSSDSSRNSVFISNFATDSMLGLPDTRGGLVEGDLILVGLGSLEEPAIQTRIDDGSFFNSLAVVVESFGNQITFELTVGEVHVEGDELPDQFAFFILDAEEQSLASTGDPLGADAFFAICVTGEPGGDLEVFDPTTLEEGTNLNIVVPVEPPPMRPAPEPGPAPEPPTPADECGGGMCLAFGMTMTLLTMLTMLNMRRRLRQRNL